MTLTRLNLELNKVDYKDHEVLKGFLVRNLKKFQEANLARQQREIETLKQDEQSLLAAREDILHQQAHTERVQQQLAEAEANKPVFIGGEKEQTHQVEQELSKVSLHRLGKQEEIRVQELRFRSKTAELDKKVAQAKGMGDRARKHKEELEK